VAVFEQQAVQLDFFDYLFSNDEGYVCIATIPRPYQREKFNEEFFEWPKQRDDIVDYIGRASSNSNIYYCVNILSVPKRRKENAIPQNLVWADLDTCTPDKLDIPPQCVIESSPGRYQAVWRLDRKLDPLDAQMYSKRVAYAHADLGVDKSGYDLTQLLRVPGTYNFKYELDEVPEVQVLLKSEKLLPPQVFETLARTEDAPLEEWTGIPVPEASDLPDVMITIEMYKDHLKQTAFARYYGDEPNEDWSKSLWRLINTCLEVGMNRNETFAVARTSKCNKYERDGRPESHLWREVLKAELQHKSIEALITEYRQELVMPQLLTSSEIDGLDDTIMDSYKGWAETVTDAVPEFHELSCAILLSALMSTSLRVHSSLPAPMNTNLFGLILGDSTLTRKTTAMNMAMDFIHEIDRSLIVASDASAEGLMDALSGRPKMVSIFMRDEVTGLLDAFQRKDFMSGVPEILTHMYDVPKHYSRRLKKGPIAVIEPIFIFFGGGITERAYSLIPESYFISGFIPRFLVVRGETDMTRVRLTGPRVESSTLRRDELRQTFGALHQMYTKDEITIQVGDPSNPSMVTLPQTVDVELTNEAWERANVMEQTMTSAALGTAEESAALPSFTRMYFSMLKLAALLAATRKEPTEEYKLTVELTDLLSAAFYIQRWGVHFVHLVRNSGHSKDETLMQAVYRLVERKPGIMRGDVMSYHHLNARMMTDIQDTLEQRLMIQVSKKGRGIQLWPIGR